MGEQKHTPGPWSVGDAPYGHYIFGADGFEVASAPSSSAIHRDYYGHNLGDEHWASTDGAYRDVDDGEPEANARLIAASPELRAAQFPELLTETATVLRMAKEHISDPGMLALMSALLPSLREAAQISHAAIAKAEGRS